MQICLHETFILGPRKVRLCRHSNTFGPEHECTADLTLFHSSVQHGIVVGNPKLQYDSEDKNTLEQSQSSWTGISLASQSREKHDGIGGADW